MQEYLLAICYGATGDANKKEELLRGIVTYTTEQQGYKLDDLFGLLALKNLGEQERLREHISKLQNHLNGNTTTSQIVLALYNNNLEKARVMLGEANIPEDHIEGLIATLTY